MADQEHARQGLPGSAMYQPGNVAQNPPGSGGDGGAPEPSGADNGQQAPPADNDAATINPPSHGAASTGAQPSASMAGKSARPGFTGWDSPQNVQQHGTPDTGILDAPARGSPAPRGLDEHGSLASPDGSDSPITP